ncbi:MAG: protein kinase [Planctomycetes bacterium]|nr:protein kinase [Planctomycetota bacterium]
MNSDTESRLCADASWIPDEAVYDRFEAAWLKPSPPALEDYLPAPGSAERSRVLYELIKIDLEHRWKRGERTHVESYVERFPELGEAPVELLAEEMAVRQAVGAAPDRVEMNRRFSGNIPPALVPFIAKDTATLSESHPTANATWNSAPSDARPGPNTGIPRTIGRYQIIEAIGRGGFATVFRGWDDELHRHVALKIPHTSIAADPEMDGRFMREARATARLRHPAIVSLHEVGHDGDSTYLVYDLVSGPNLAEVLKKTQPAPEQAAQWVARLADALDYAHQNGIIHRDVKPANILLDEGNQPVLSDFGLASCKDAGPTLTATGDILGTPAYMSPEQAKGLGNAIDARTDVYSLGVLLYEILCGRIPFQGPGASVLHKIIHEDPRAPRQLRPSIPLDLETICLKAMAKEPARRYASAGELADDLRRYLRHEPIRARRIGPAARFARWCRRNPALAATIAGAIAIIALITGFGFQRVVQERNRAQRLAADLALDRGIALADEGDVAQGLLWMAKALELAPAQETHLRDAVRANLGAWQNEVARPRAVMALAPESIVVPADRNRQQVFFISDTSAQRFDLTTQQKIGAPLLCAKKINTANLSPDGKMVVTADQSGMIRFWDSVNGQPHGEPIRFEPGAHTMCFHPSGAWLMASSGAKVQRFAVAERKPIGAAIADRSVWGTPSPDGTTVLTIDDLDVLRWDAVTGKLQEPPLKHDTRCAPLAYSPKGKFILVRTEGTLLHVWNAQTATKVLSTAAIVGEGSIAFNDAENRIAVATKDDFVRIWDLAETATERASLTTNPLRAAVALDAAGEYLATGGFDRTVELWDVAAGKRIGAVLSHADPVAYVTFAPNGRTLLTLSGNSTAKLWDIDPAASRARVLQHPFPVWSAAFSGDGKFLLTGCGLVQPADGGSAHLWNARTAQPIGPPLPHRGKVGAVAVSPDGKLLVTGEYGVADRTSNVLHIWDSATNRKLDGELNELVGLGAMAISPDSRYLFTGNTTDKSAQQWDLKDRKRTPLRLPHQEAVRAIRFTRDGKFVLTGSYDKTARLWDAATGEPRSKPLENPGQVGAVDISPDGRWIVTGNDYRVALIWDAVSGQTVGAPLQHRGTVRAVAFHPSRDLVLTGSSDRTARLWDRVTCKSIGPFFRHDAGVEVAQFSPDGETILTGARDKTARLWALPPVVEGSNEQIRTWIEVLTGMELDDRGNARSLDAASWEQRKQKLERLGWPLR